MRDKLHVNIILALLLNRYLVPSQFCSNIETQFFVFLCFLFLFLQLNQLYSLSKEEVDYQDLRQKISVMDNYFALGEVNMAIQEAGTLLFSLKMVSEQANEGLLQVSSADQI